jgi:uncharacterized protein (DUF1501 family)
MLITRRSILKGIGAAGVMGAYGLLPIPGLRSLVFSANNNGPILIVLHLRGGCDGLNLISPASDPDFIAARVSDLRVAADGSAAGYMLSNGPSSDIDFRLHNAAGGMAELYKNGNLAFIHACGLTNATRSHFVATDMIEHGVASDADLARTTSGWLTRALQTGKPLSPSVRAVSATGAVSNDLSEMDYAMAIPNLDGGLGPVGGPAIGKTLAQLYANQPGEVAEAGRTAIKLMADIDARLPRDKDGHVIGYHADADYDFAADFQKPLKTIAQLIKMDMGLEVATLDLGDWDTHENQPGRFKNNVQRLSDGLSAFWNDMSAYHDRMVVVTVTEFGRRLRSNKSNGTDHGRSSVMSVLGGKIAGGKCYGRWPGLKSEQLDEGVDLAVTTDYRQVLSEILDQRSGNMDAAWFPNFRPADKLGLFNRA